VDWSKQKNTFKSFLEGEHLCALLWFKVNVETDCEPKIQRYSPSTALVMAIPAFSILSHCIINWGKVKKFLKLLPDGEHLIAWKVRKNYF